MEINNITVEYLKNPIGIDIRSPRVCWLLKDIKEQKSFEIIYKVNDGEEKIKHHDTSNMYYDFEEEFNSRDIVTFRIKVKDQDGKCVESSPSIFEMGLLEKDEWKAKWICGDYKVNKKHRYPVDYFLKEFTTDKIVKARLYITSCGLYEATINEKRVGDFILAPGSTDYSKRIQYQTYDIKDLLKEGLNKIEIKLADGWYRGSIGAKGFTYVFGKETKLIAQLELTTENGVKTIISDNTWLWSNDGPIRFADLKDGEIIDSRMKPSYKKFAKEIFCKANLTASNNEYVIENDSFSPIKMWESKGGNIIMEFTNNIAGYLSFSVDANEGDELSIKLGEMLDSDGEVTLKNIQCVRKGKRTPLQEIHYICHNGKNNYSSKFFFGGFKYATIKTNLKLDINNFKQIAIHTKLNQTASFECSNNLINIFFENTLRSLKSNSIDIPTDCPTRERMGWTGDSQVFFETASFLTNYQTFTRKHIVDVYDRQDKNGRLPQIAPYSAEDWFMDVMNGSVGWADVGILTPYRFYKKYGDKRLLVDNFHNMERYAKFMIKRCGRTKGIYSIYAKPLHLSKENRKYQVNTGQSYGEWAEPNDVKAFVWTDFCEPHPEESMAYTAWMMRLMAEICDIVGNTTNKEVYLKYEKGITKAYQELITKPNHSFDTNRQAKLVRPLFLKLLSNEQEKFAKKRLIKALDFYNWRLGTGFLSTPFILNVLADINPEYAYRLLENEKMPGWLYMAKNNTGTIWEGWEGPNSQQGISSLNHYSKGAMVEWLINGMCGINVVGQNRFLLKPIIGGNISYAKASYESIYGTISLNWQKKEGKIYINFVVPENTKAQFIYKDIDVVLETGTYNYEF